MIYMLEDDSNIRGFVIYALESSGLEARGFEKPSDFWPAVDESPPRLVLLDVMLPQEDGLEILRKLRSRHDTKKIPVIMVSARGGEYDKIVGLDSGADDYVAKPFAMMELISRVRALMRRTEQGGEPEYYSAGGVTVCPSKRSVKVGGEDVSLTYKEFELLSTLAACAGKVFTRDQLLREIWGYDFDGENRTVDVHIRTLRAKLGKYGGVIETVRGVGYRIGEQK